MNLFRTIIAASSIVLAPVAITMAVPGAAQATPLGCTAGFLGLGAAAAGSAGGVTTVPSLLAAGGATAVIFDQCPMMPKEGQVMDIPAGATCVALDNPKNRVPCPSKARVYPGQMVA
ncbi:hypothetical protein [Nocardia carnea]|uniref:Uncharacterized protein n=1 Tax=Nocardia carnea TaxID=37328 RepID=A0ABW7TS16_9NOCA|nr:hypothetical protein [Nocardia carnea]